MIIKDVVTLAKYSELSGVAAKNDIDVITAFINLGMLELHKRFTIKVEEVVISLEDNKTYYDMPDNCLYATEAYGESPEEFSDAAVPIAINEPDEPLSVFFNDWDTVQVPASISGAYISIIYVAKPVYITAEQAEDGVTELDISDSLIDCLLSYIGYKGHLGVKSDSSSENNAHWQRFERNCKKVEDLGVAFPTDSMNMNTRIDKRGFV